MMKHGETSRRASTWAGPALLWLVGTLAACGGRRPDPPGGQADAGAQLAACATSQQEFFKAQGLDLGQVDLAAFAETLDRPAEFWAAVPRCE